MVVSTAESVLTIYLLGNNNFRNLLGVPEIKMTPAADAFSTQMKKLIGEKQQSFMVEHGHLYQDLSQKRKQDLLTYEQKMNRKVQEAYLEKENWTRQQNGDPLLTLKDLPNFISVSSPEPSPPTATEPAPKRTSPAAHSYSKKRQ